MEVAREDTINLKRAKKYFLIQEHEMVKMQQGETNSNVHKTISLGLGKFFEKMELNEKVLKSSKLKLILYHSCIFV